MYVTCKCTSTKAVLCCALGGLKLGDLYLLYLGYFFFFSFLFAIVIVIAAWGAGACGVCT